MTITVFNHDQEGITKLEEECNLDLWIIGVCICVILTFGLKVSKLPYDDGNGRIARAISDIALADDEGTGRRLYSLSAQIIQDRKEYYEILEKTQKGTCDITVWLQWFVEMYTRAVTRSEDIIKKAFLIAKFWQTRSFAELNERQLKAIQSLLEAEPAGFEGGLTNRKYVSLTRTSRETAKRDLADLEKKGLLKRNDGKGRSVSYSLVLLASVTD